MDLSKYKQTLPQFGKDHHHSISRVRQNTLFSLGTFYVDVAYSLPVSFVSMERVASIRMPVAVQDDETGTTILPSTVIKSLYTPIAFRRITALSHDVYAVLPDCTSLIILHGRFILRFPSRLVRQNCGLFSFRRVFPLTSKHTFLIRHGVFTCFAHLQ